MDISNIGIDIIDIDRFRKKDYSNNKKFYQRIFSESEFLFSAKNGCSLMSDTLWGGKNS